jgi:hypothetical protein
MINNVMKAGLLRGTSKRTKRKRGQSVLGSLACYQVQILYSYLDECSVDNREEGNTYFLYNTPHKSPGRVKNFLHIVQTGSGVHPTSYPVGAGGKAVGA